MTRAVFGLLVFTAAAAHAQEYVIFTYAGGVPPPTPTPGVSMPIEGGGRFGAAADAAGDVYFTAFNCVFKIDPAGIVTLIAGTSRAGFSGDGGEAIRASLNLTSSNFQDQLYIGSSGASPPAAIAVDGLGNVFVADNGNYRIRRISVDGTIDTVAGNGSPGIGGDGGPASYSQLSDVGGLALDFSGNLFISESAYGRIRQVMPDGTITTVAGTGTSPQPLWADCRDSGDGGPALNATLCAPLGLATDATGNLFVAEPNRSVRKISPDGTIATVPVQGAPGFAGGALSEPTSVAVDQQGNLFSTDTTVDEYCGDFVQEVVAVSSNATVSKVAGNGLSCPYFYAPCDLGDGMPARQAYLDGPLGLSVDGAGNVFIADTWHSRLRKVSLDGTIATVAGGPMGPFAGDGGPATRANLFHPNGLAVDTAGNLFIASASNERIRKVSPQGIIETVAGNGTPGLSGDGGPATSAQLNDAAGVAVDPSGNLFIADTANKRIRKVSPDGIITTVPASVGLTTGNIAVDAAGNLYLDGNRKLSPDGSVTPVINDKVAVVAPVVDPAGNLLFIGGSPQVGS